MRALLIYPIRKDDLDTLDDAESLHSFLTTGWGIAGDEWVHIASHPK